MSNSKPGIDDGRQERVRQSCILKVALMPNISRKKCCKIVPANIKHTSDLYLTKCRTHEYHDEVNKLNTEGQWFS